MASPEVYRELAMRKARQLAATMKGHAKRMFMRAIRQQTDKVLAEQSRTIVKNYQLAE